MPCLVLLLALISPRLALAGVLLFSDLLGRAFDGWIVPLLGFLLLPWTTLAYVLMWSSADRVNGIEWFLVALGFLVDVGVFSGGRRGRG